MSQTKDSYLDEKRSGEYEPTWV